MCFYWQDTDRRTRWYIFDLVIHYKEKKRGLGLSGKSPQRTWDVLCRTCCCPKQSLGGPCQLPPKHVCSSSSSDRHEWTDKKATVTLVTNMTGWLSLEHNVSLHITVSMKPLRALTERERERVCLCQWEREVVLGHSKVFIYVCEGERENVCVCVSDTDIYIYSSQASEVFLCIVLFGWLVLLWFCIVFVVFAVTMIYI